MKYRFVILLMLVLSGSSASYAQLTKDELKENRDEKRAANNDKVDYTVFRRQILALPEFSEQRRKLADIKKSGKGMPKIYAVVDSMNEKEDGKTLIGFIQIGVSDNLITTHELTFDRVLKKIVVIKPTGEKLELDKEHTTDNAAKPTAKPTAKKKKTDDDDEEDEEEEEKPTKGKQKDDED